MDFLMGRLNYERVDQIPYHRQHLKLERMQRLLDRLGNPEQQLNIIHVAGSKGKGSTVMTLSSLLTTAGVNAGTYTSPHLQHIEERIRINGTPIEIIDFVELLRRIRPAVEAMDRDDQTPSRFSEPTYFEILTAAAMLHFADRRVRWCLLEVGLGGRLDSTNVCQPLITVITSISLDHTRQLGMTLAEIAGEKAGILKPSVPLVSGVKTGPAREVIESTAQQAGCDVYTLGDEFNIRYQPAGCQPVTALGPAAEVDPEQLTSKFDFQSSEVHYRGLPLQLPGRHQAENAALALQAMSLLQPHGVPLDRTAVLDGLHRVRCPARVEILPGQPTMVVDTAHNVASIRALLDALAERFDARRWVFVFGTTRGKPVREMIQLLLGRAHALVLTKYVHNPRAVKPQVLGSIAAEVTAESIDATDTAIRVADDPQAAWELAMRLAADDDVVCVTGSFFLAAELMPTMRQRSSMVSG